MKIFKIFLHPFTSFIDWYIKKKYSNKYYHEDMILPEIKKRLQNQKDELVKKHNIEIDALKKQMSMDFKIKEDGYIAEISQYQNREDENNVKYKKMMDFFYHTKGCSQDIAIVGAKNKQVVLEIQHILAEFLGKMDTIEYNAVTVNEKLEKEEKKYLENTKKS